MSSEQSILKQRDDKVMAHLEQYSPVWLVHQQVLTDSEAVRFNVVFQHRLYGWVNRQYYYDAFNDVLYHKGQTLVPQDQALDIQETDPWIAPEPSDVANSYGG